MSICRVVSRVALLTIVVLSVSAKPPKYQLSKEDKMLIAAARSGDGATVRRLVPNATIVALTTAMNLSEQKSRTEVSRILMSRLMPYARKVVSVDSGKTALMFAAELGQSETIKALVKNGADIDQQMDAERLQTTTMVSGNARSQSSQPVRVSGGNNALSCAILAEQVTSVKTLVELGADLERRVIYQNGGLVAPRGVGLFDLNATSFSSQSERSASIRELARMSRNAKIVAALGH